MEPMAGDHGCMPKKPTFPSKIEHRTKSRRRRALVKSVPSMTRELHLGQWLARLELDQIEVAKKARIGKSYISHLVSGKKKNPSALKMLLVSEAMGITVNDLYRAPPPRSELEAGRNLRPDQIALLGDLASLLKGAELKK